MKIVPGRHFSARPGVGPASRAPSLPSPVLDRMIAHFLKVGSEAGGRNRLASSADAVLTTVRQAADAGRWQGVVELAKVAEPAFQLSAQWDAWESVLQAALRASRALNDAPSEGWALHQLGIRALALGDHDYARELLSEALAVRIRAGEQDAAALTRSQLAQVAARSTT